MKTLLNPKPKNTDKALTSGDLAARVRVARERLDHQHDPALLNALSEQELQANRALAERVREHERREQIAQIETAAAAADRVRRTAEQLAEQEAIGLVTAQRAITEQKNQSSPHMRLAWLYKRRTVVLRCLTALMGAAMLYSAVTVQQNIAPGGPADPAFWLSYGLEAFVSGVLIALMLSESDTADWITLDPKAKQKARFVEAGLLALTVGLNTYPYFHASDLYGVVVHAIAPIMIGVMLIAYNVVAARYSLAIGKATAAIPDAEAHIADRLASLTRITAAAPHPAPRTTELDCGSATGTAGSAPAVHPAPAAAPRTTAGPHPAPAPAVTDDPRTTPAVAAGGDQDPAGETAPEQAPELTVVRTRTEIPHHDNNPDEDAATTRTDLTSHDDPAPTGAGADDDPEPADEALVPAVRTRTTPQSPAPARSSIELAPTAATTRTTAGGPAAATALKQEPGWMSPVFELAAEVKSRGVAKSKTIEDVAAVITAIDAKTSNNAIAHTERMSHNTVKAIRETVAEIRHEHSGGGRIIELRKQAQA